MPLDPSPRQPHARQDPVRHTLHGHTRIDDYAWLRDANWREVMRRPEALDQAIRAHLEAENAYAEAVLAPTADLRARLVAEMKGRIKDDDESVPAPDGDYAYFRRFAPGAEHPAYLRRPSAGGPEEIVLDAAAEARATDYFRLAQVVHAPDHRHLAFAADRNGSERYTVQVRDLASGRLLPDAVGNAHGMLAWAADGRTFLYTALDAHHRPSRVFRHRLGDDPAEDRLVYEETDPGFYLALERSESGRFLFITSHDHQTAEVWAVAAAAPDAAPFCIAPREAGMEYEATDHGGDFLIRTNSGGAEDFKIVTAPIAEVRAGRGRACWRDLVAHRPGTLIRAILDFRDFLVRLERVDGLPRIVVRRHADGAEHAIGFDEEVYELGLSPGYEYDTATLRFTYSSMTTPERVFDYDMGLRARTLRKEQSIPSGHDPSDYVCRRLMARAPDGERVPVSVLLRRDLALDGQAPLLLYGYGSYGITYPANFQTNRLSLVDRGFVFALAHVRGGMDRGYRWYRDGKLEKKTNTFDDFVAVAEHLIAERYTRAGSIVIHGGSAGGMLVGAAANRRPDLWRAAIAEVPFVDVLNTMCDATLPLTPPEWTEWGNPIEDAAAYRRILAYSPYDNVAERAYPHVFALSGLTDPRVTYWEPAKWTARLRERATNGALILNRTNMGAGHGGASGRYGRLDEVALVYAFALAVSGRDGTEPASSRSPAATG